jgi:hypothetical protein
VDSPWQSNCAVRGLIMNPPHRASAFLDQEARALKTRLGRVRFFSLFETYVPAASPSRDSFSAIEHYLARGRSDLAQAIDEFRRWIESPGGRNSKAELGQAKLCLLRLQFNNVLSQFDLFADALTQRSENGTGIWLAGLDAAATDALRLEGGFYGLPPVVCYLDRGPGAAIRRARTRLPGGGQSPVAIIRVPRERMVGSGIASSLVHEVGHQGCALLGLVESMRPVLLALERKGGPERAAWWFWERWISEILADFWAVGRLGITATMGLMSVVSLPSSMVYRISAGDPHPSPWVRVLLSATMGAALFPHLQWSRVRRLWMLLYPPSKLPPQQRKIFALLLDTAPTLAALITNHRPRALKGRTLAEVMRSEARSPDGLMATWQRWRRSPRQVRAASPTLAFAVLGQARWAGWLSPEAESSIVARLLEHWALGRALKEGVPCRTCQPGNLILRRKQ